MIEICMFRHIDWSIMAWFVLVDECIPALGLRRWIVTSTFYNIVCTILISWGWIFKNCYASQFISIYCLFAYIWKLTWYLWKVSWFSELKLNLYSCIMTGMGNQFSAKTLIYQLRHNIFVGSSVSGPKTVLSHYKGLTGVHQHGQLCIVLFS